MQEPSDVAISFLTTPVLADPALPRLHASPAVLGGGLFGFSLPLFPSSLVQATHLSS